jgi:hypothetical protein
MAQRRLLNSRSGGGLLALRRMQHEELEGGIYVRGSDQVPANLSTLRCDVKQSWRQAAPTMSASLSRPMSSVALITSYRRRLALLACHTGLSLLFEVGARPPHDGMRRMGRPNLSGALAAD